MQLRAKISVLQPVALFFVLLSTTIFVTTVVKICCRLTRLRLESDCVDLANLVLSFQRSHNMYFYMTGSVSLK